MSNDFDCVIVGGGVIGLACARFFSMKGMYVCLIEKESRIAHKQVLEIVRLSMRVFIMIH